MKCSPALSRYWVSLKSTTSPGADCPTPPCNVIDRSPTFDMSISPRIRATGRPSWSSNWMSASIAVHLDRSAQLDGSPALLAPDRHLVHQGLHQLQPATTVLATRLTPGSVVAHAHDHMVVAPQRLEVEARFTRGVGVLDRVRTGLTRGQRDVVERL